MKLLLALSFAVCCIEVGGISIIPGPDPIGTEYCLPQPFAVIPIQGHVRNRSTGLCNDSSEALDATLSKNLAKQIAGNAPALGDCKLSGIQEVSCSSHRRRISFSFSAKVTCGNNCDRVTDDQTAFQSIRGIERDLRGVIRTNPKPRARFNSLNGPVVVHYFKGRRSPGYQSVGCVIRSNKTIGPRKQFPSCVCPQHCGEKEDVCSLSPETGVCRASFPRFFYNSTSSQCERFIYGGCGGNKNNFQTRTECVKACSSKQCPEGKMFQDCGTACPKTCANKDTPVRCAARCVEGCFCPAGTVELGNKCVAPEKCPIEEPLTSQCPEGKVFQGCGTACPKTCDNQSPLICTLQCVQGCFCPAGTVELGDKCVAPEKCPTEEPPTSQCPEGKVFQDCGKACPKTCDNKDEGIICTQQCVSGCFCPDGTVELGDKCVAPEKCPTEESPTSQCPEGKVFQDCGTACPKTCDNQLPLICTLQCVQGCFCPAGTVELGDKCVAPEKCPTEEPPTSQCPEGKVFQDCGTACPKTCDNKDRLIPCTKQCVSGCFCPAGTVELGDKCVAPEQCPTEEPPTSQCPEGKVFQDCGTACPKTCDNQSPLICTLQCVQGCFCPAGTVELGDKCVAPEKCPTEEPPTSQCPEGKVFQDCGTACPKTCDNKDRLIPCTKQCVSGCFCPSGMVESGDACVSPDECK